MILQLEHWHHGYSQILRDCRSAANENEDGSPSTGSALILCNADADAMSAARILTYMLRSDGITYQLRPCTSYGALQSILADRVDDTLRAVVLLNLGSSRNLTRVFQDCNLTLSTKLYVIDCRRPFHLANIYAGENIVVFWDQTQTDDIPSDGDNLSGNDNTTSEEDDSSTDDDDDDESKEENRFTKGEDPDEGEEEFDAGEIARLDTKGRGRDEVSDYDGEDEHDKDDDNSIESDKEDVLNSDAIEDINPALEEKSHSDISFDRGEDDGNDNIESPPHKNVSMTPRELHLQRRNMVRLYYNGGSFYGSPAAYVAYRLSTQLRFGELGDLLWLACVGVTDAYQHSRLDVAGYTTLAMDLRHQCQRLFPNDMYHRVGTSVYAEHLMGCSNQAGSQLTKIGSSDNGRILSEKDYRFFLLRHTSLFDSMVHSNYVSTKLQSWTNRGMHKLMELLAKCGFPLDECRQPYAFMKPTLKRRLREQISNFAEEYGLDNFEFTSFFRVTGFKSLLSASDTSFAITALLECETPQMVLSGRKPLDEDEETIQAFNVAFDALSSSSMSSMNFNGLGGGEGSTVSNLVNGGTLSGQTGIGAGIRLALLLQRSIILTAVSLVDRNAITRLRHFRYAYITCTSMGESQTQDLIRPPDDSADDQKTHIFAKPLALTKLAHFLMDMHRENGKWTGSKSRPLVLMAEKPITSTYLVVGYEFSERAGSFVKNRFGQNFSLAASSMKGAFKFESFDSNVVEVSSADVQRFIEQLHYLMDSM